MKRLCLRSLTQQQLPLLEGMLEKKSASIFRGWEKRWFKVDPKTFILSYHFSKDDYGRGFTLVAALQSLGSPTSSSSGTLGATTSTLTW
ncbi:PH domain-like [Phytophthora cactorum]|nr:PH domain-like [Phytophthora cactorum]